MRNQNILAAAVLAAALGGCMPDGIADATREESNAAGQPPPPEAGPLAGEGQARILDAFDTPAGSRIEFVEVNSGTAGGVLVLEHGAASAPALERLFDAAGRTLNAADVYRSLVEGADADDAVLARLVDLAGAATLERPAGWALGALNASAPLVLAAAGQIACDNTSFTGSIPGGFLPKVGKRLDTGPDFHPAIWEPYDWSGKTHYWYQAAWAKNTWGWRGKVCGKAGFHPDVRFFNGWYPSIPVVKFLYRGSNGWAQAGSAPIGSSPQTVAWIYNGEVGGLDWKIMIYDAYLFDEFDVLMTWL